MNTENAVLRRQALDALSGKWGMAIGVMLLYSIIPIAAQFIIGPFMVLVTPPLMLGMAIFSLSLSRGRNPQVKQLFDGFERYGTSLAAWLLTLIFVLLWSLLLIIPGIIAALSYAMTFYIIADDPSISALEAINRSKAMMMGNKAKLLFLGLSFIGWALLSILTLGIGFLWLGPYINVSYAKFYDDLKGQVAAA